MEFLRLFLRRHFTGKVVVASLISLLWTVVAMQPLFCNHTFSHDRCNNIPCYNKANYTSPLIDESVKKVSSLVYVLKFFRKCWNFFAKSWLFFSGYHVLGICFSGFSAVIIRIINMSVMWLCNVIVKMGKKCNLSNKGILACHFCFCIFLFVFEGFQSNIIITFAFWYMSFIEQRYWSCCITRWCGLGLGHYNAVWIHLKLFVVKYWWSDSILQPDAKMSKPAIFTSKRC